MTIDYICIRIYIGHIFNFLMEFLKASWVRSVLSEVPITKKTGALFCSFDAIENLNHNKMLDPLGQAWQNGSALAA